MAKVDELVIELRAQTGQFDSAMGKAGNTTRGFEAIAARASIAAAAIGVALVATAKKAIDMAGRMKDLSLETGVAATTFSALQAPLQKSGSSVEEFASSIVRMNRGISDAASGNNENLAKTFTELGLSLDKLKTLTPEEKLNEVILALARVKDQGDLTRLGVDIFGRSFSGLIPVIKETNGNLADYTRAAQDAGDALTQEQIDRLDAFGDAIVDTGIKIGNAIAGGFSDLLMWFDESSTKLERFIDRSNTLKAIYDSIPEDSMKAARKGITDRRDAAYAEKARAAGFTTTVKTGIIFDQKEPQKSRAIGANVARKTTQVKKEALQQDAHIIEYNKELLEIEKERERQIDALGVAASNSFKDAVLGAESFEDALGSLGKQIESVLFDRIVSQPLNQLIGGITKSASGGIGDIFGSLFGGGGGASSGGSIFDGLSDFLPSFAVGTNNVPKDMTANIHKGEMIVPAYDAAKMRNGGMGGGDVNVTVINNAGASVRTQSSQNQNGGTDMKILIDEAVANNISQRGTKTSQALQAFSSQTNVRR